MGINIEKVTPGKYVELGYDLYTIDSKGNETLVHQTDKNDPEKIVFGITKGVLRPLEVALEGLEQGGEFDVTVKSEEAFGPHDPDQVVTLDKNIFVVEGKFDEDVIKQGAYVPMMTEDGYHINGLVTEVTADNVVMDFNHPLAGKDVRFRGKVTLVRDATPDELKPAHHCGCGCDHDDCGCDHDDCGCDHDDCGCDDHDGCGCGHHCD